MKKILFLISICMMCFAFPLCVQAEEIQQDLSVEENDITEEVKKSPETPVQPTGWIKDGGTWYYRDTQGNLLTGWLKWNNLWYYLNADGRMATGWVQDKNIWYYLDGSGAMVNDGWNKINNRWYFLQGSGAMVTGWCKVSGKWYYMWSMGSMATGWVKDGDTWYYLSGSGAMVNNGWNKINNRWYFLQGSGAMVTGWCKVSGKWYYMWSTGSMATGWVQDGNIWYYLKESGAMATGWIKSGNTWYYLRSNGAMVTGWLKDGNTWYYLRDNGSMVASQKMTIDGVAYQFNRSGAWVGNKEDKIIAIDPGHQLNQNTGKEANGPGSGTMKQKVTSGTYGPASGLNEYELNLSVSLKLQKELEARGYKVYMTRTVNEVNISNAERAQMATKAGADILVRIHANGEDNTSIHGALTMAPESNNPYLNSNIIGKSQELSQRIVDNLCAATGARNRGIMYTNTMTGINWSTIPVTIVEMGYMSNRTEDLNMADNSYQNKIVQGIANGIDGYYGW